MAKDTMADRMQRAGLRDDDDDDNRYGQVRALTMSRGKAAGQSELIGDDPFNQQGLYTQRGRLRVLTPPLGPGSLETLINFAEESDILPQCIRAFETNIDGFGQRFEAIGDTDEEKKANAESPEGRAEYARLSAFFEYCYDDGSIIELRKRKRRDQESMGIGYWEVLRDRKGDIAGFNHAPGHTMRMTARDSEVVTIDEQRRQGNKIVTVKVARRFRSFCQIVSAGGRDKVVWFKEFGDPRSIDMETGKYYRTNLGVKAGNEIIPFPVRYFALSPYSVPRWIGNLPGVMGSRAADEVNLLYFDNKTVPPMVVTVSGGMLTRQSVKRLERLFLERKGREHFHEALILEAQPPKDDGSAPQGGRQLPKITLQPLTDQMVKDAMFMGYGQNNRLRQRSSFGLPPIFTGETEDYTRATAENSRVVAEEQLFQPERHEFDYLMNRRVMPMLGASNWRYVSAGPNITLNEDLIWLLATGEASGGFTPNLARKIISDIIEQPVPQITEGWGDIPWSATLAALRAGQGPQTGVPVENPPGSAERGRQMTQRVLAGMPSALKAALLADLRKEVDRRLQGQENDVLKLVQRELAKLEA